MELTWPNNTIENEWLQVTVLADADTGLSANDVFYYGNAIGDTGVSTTNAQVTELDVAAVQANETSQASITNDYDFNRDGQVNAADVSIVQANQTTAANALNLISVPTMTVATPFATEQPALMESWGEYGYFFAPVIVQTPDGTLISVAEARTGTDDSTVEGIAETTSTDGGQTWSAVSIITQAPDFPTNVLAMGSMVVDQTTGQVFLVYTVNDAQVYLISTTNDGQTWSTLRISVERNEPELGLYRHRGGQRHSAHHRARRRTVGGAFDYRYATDTSRQPRTTP